MATETDVRPMDDKHRNILKRCKGTLVKDMEPDEVLLQMADSLLFTTEDENKIKSKVTRQQQCGKLLEMLQRKGAKAYEIFKKTLEIVHPHLAITIEEAENKELNYEPRLERENSAHRRRFAYTKVKQGTPTDKELEKLGMDIGDIWKKLGRRLYVTDAKQKEIDRAHKLLSEKAYYTLKHWKQSKGAAANYQALCDALQDEGVERQDLVEKYCYIKEMDTGTRPLVMGPVEPSRPIQAEQVSSTEIDTATRPLAVGRVQPSRPMQAEQGSSTVMATGTRPPAVGLVEPSRSIHAEHLETLESQIVDAVKQLQVVEANCEDVENRLKEKQQELQVVEANCKDVENRLKEKQEELRIVEGKCKEVGNRFKEKQEGMDIGTRPPSVGGFEPAEHLETLESQIVDAVKQLQVVEANCKDVENRLKEKQEELQVVEANCKDVEDRLKEKQEELKDVEGKCKDAENRLKEKQEEKKTVPPKKAVTLVEITGMMKDLETDWKELATVLELGEANIRKIRKESKTDREKAYVVLTMWTDKEGEDATVERLIDTLEKIAKSRPVEKMPEEDEDEQAAKLLKEFNDEILVENRKKEGRKDTSLQAASVKKLNIQLQEASSQEGKKPKRKVYKKKAMAN